MDRAGWGYSKQMDPGLKESLIMGLAILHQSGLDYATMRNKESGVAGRGIKSSIGKINLEIG